MVHPLGQGPGGVGTVLSNGTIEPMALFVAKFLTSRVLVVSSLVLAHAQAAPPQGEAASADSLADEQPTPGEGELASGNLGLRRADADRGPISATELVLRACLENHEQAQVSRIEGRLLEAEQYLLACLKSECPAAVRSDCATWRGEVLGAFPSIVVRAQGDRGDIAEGRVFVDGVEVEGGLDGKSLRLDPGIRFIRVMLNDGEQRERRLVLSQGEKSRLVVFDFRTEPEFVKSSPPVTGSVSQGTSTRPVPVSTIVLGSIAVGAGALAIGFGVDALGHQNRAEDECAPFCPNSVRERVNRSALISDVSLGLSLAAIAGAIVIYVLASDGFRQRRKGWLLPWSMAFFGASTRPSISN